jgi:hypothetical protein
LASLVTKNNEKGRIVPVLIISWGAQKSMHKPQ